MLSLAAVVMMSVLEEMGTLIRTTPGPRASAAEVARWYELKARMLEHVAEESRTGRGTALRQAAAAHRHATDVRAGRR